VFFKNDADLKKFLADNVKATQVVACPDKVADVVLSCFVSLNTKACLHLQVAPKLTSSRNSLDQLFGSSAYLENTATAYDFAESAMIPSAPMAVQYSSIPQPQTSMLKSIKSSTKKPKVPKSRPMAKPKPKARSMAKPAAAAPRRRVREEAAKEVRKESRQRQVKKKRMPAAKPKSKMAMMSKPKPSRGFAAKSYYMDDFMDMDDLLVPKVVPAMLRVFSFTSYVFWTVSRG
jgi:hypothetical protein